MILKFTNDHCYGLSLQYVFIMVWLLMADLQAARAPVLSCRRSVLARGSYLNSGLREGILTWPASKWMCSRISMLIMLTTILLRPSLVRPPLNQSHFKLIHYHRTPSSPPASPSHPSPPPPPTVPCPRPNPSSIRNPSHPPLPPFPSCAHGPGTISITNTVPSGCQSISSQELSSPSPLPSSSLSSDPPYPWPSSSLYSVCSGHHASSSRLWSSSARN
jgi:hypothetical protein